MDELKIEKNKKLSPFTTFGIGGNAELFVEATSIQHMQKALQFASHQKLPFFILGKGSNTLFDSAGFEGIVILNKIDFCIRSGYTYYVGGGYSFSLLGTQTAREHLSGLEFAAGIPGSVGGAVFMNAGANGRETAETLVAVEYVNSQGEILLFKKEDLLFSYRHSPFQNKYGAIVSATFSLSPSENARSQQLEIINYRKKTQPLRDSSAGCVFRNPPSYYAGGLIEKCGLKGFSIGGAQISPIHANFIVNTGNATSENIKELIEHIQNTVKEKTGVQLEHEIRIIPRRISPDA